MFDNGPVSFPVPTGSRSARSAAAWQSVESAIGRSRHAGLKKFASNLHRTSVALKLCNAAEMAKDSSFVSRIIDAAPFPYIQSAELGEPAVLAQVSSDAMELLQQLGIAQVRGWCEAEFPQKNADGLRLRFDHLRELWLEAALVGTMLIARIQAAGLCDENQQLHDHLAASHLQLNEAIVRHGALNTERLGFEMPAWLEPRSNGRVRGKLGVCVVAAGRRVDANVVEMTDAAALIEGEIWAAKGDSLQLDFPKSRSIAAKVAWEVGPATCVAFADQFTSDAQLRQVTGQMSWER